MYHSSLYSNLRIGGYAVYNEKEGGFRLEVDAPGVLKEDISISTESDKLKISFIRKTDEAYYDRGIIKKNDLTFDLDDFEVSGAELINGVLILKLSVTEAKRAKKISIS